MTETYTFDDVAVVAATRDEERTVGPVLADVDRVTDGRAEVVCVDDSDDRTPHVARRMGATVIERESRGYGDALREAVLTPDRPVVVTVDCDDRYPMEALPTFLDRINDGYDVVSGDRLSEGAAAMSAPDRYGNVAFARLASRLMGRRVRDVTTGMRAYRRDLLHGIQWTENIGFSAELFVRPAMRDYDVTEVPVSYRERAGGANVDPVRDGAEMAAAIVTVCLEERLR